jgi:RNA polymerase sigma factor (sigma-70 family)
MSTHVDPRPLPSFRLHCGISAAHTERKGGGRSEREQTTPRSCTYISVWALSEESLLAGLGAGDPEAAAAFVRRFQGRVFGLALTILGDRQEAEDVAQETFVRAWRHAGAFDARRGAVATWLLTIARNVAVDAVRMRRVEPVDPGALLTREMANPPDDADDRLVAVDESRRLRTAVATLPEEQRRALVLAAFMGYTGREISEVEDVPLGTVKTRIRAAMIKLRSALEVSDE